MLLVVDGGSQGCDRWPKEAKIMARIAGPASTSSSLLLLRLLWSYPGCPMVALVVSVGGKRWWG